MKKKIELPEADEDIEDRIAKEIAKYGLAFIKLEETKDYEDIGNVIEINHLGKKYYALIKQELSDALLDPSEDDLSYLKNARDRVRGTITTNFGKIQLKESSFERTLSDKYLSSLVMNIIKYPTDEPHENLKKLGIGNKDIEKLYVEAAAAHLGSPVDIDFSRFGVHNLEKISTKAYSGTSDDTVVNHETCYEGSHYVLSLSTKEKQEKVQKEAASIDQKYLDIEKKIVEWINANTNDEIIINNATNLVRMFLNLAVLYDKNKALPIE